MMHWNIVILQKAEKDLSYFRQNHRAYYLKCFDLIRELLKYPRRGTGKPERLKHFDQEVGSRRVWPVENRLVTQPIIDPAFVSIVGIR